MKIIFLNCWHGKVWNEFSEFLIKHSGNTGVFCLMETRPNLHSKISKLLPGFEEFYENGGVYLDGYEYGQSTFVQGKLNASFIQKIKIDKNWTGQILAYRINIDSKGLIVINVHGISMPGDKMDTETRIKQSNLIIDFLKKQNLPSIVGGDFNLNPDTKSVKLFEENGYRNLIKEFNVQDTRGKINAQKYKDQEIQNFADYCFISPEVNVKSFEVPDVEISDHLPLILEFKI